MNKEFTEDITKQVKSPTHQPSISSFVQYTSTILISGNYFSSQCRLIADVGGCKGDKSMCGL